MLNTQISVWTQRIYIINVAVSLVSLSCQLNLFQAFLLVYTSLDILFKIDL